MSLTPGTPRRRGFAVAIAAAAALALSACAGGAGTPSSGEPPADSGAEIDVVNVAFPGSLANLYIGQESGILNYYLASAVQEGLVSIDPEGKVIPALAESWEMPDPTTYVFELRKDAQFQNGDPVTADDVVFSLEQARDPESSPGINFYLLNLDTVETTGDGQVTIKTLAPDPAFLKTLSSAGAAVITQQAYWEENEGKVGTSQSLLLGTGPYKVTEFQPDSNITLERVDTWWGGVPKAKKIEISFIPDENTRLLAAQKGDIDISFNVPLKQAPQWQEISGGRVEAVNDLSYAGLLFDQNVAPFDDVKVRQAISSAVDRDAIVEKLLRGYGEPANAIMTPEAMTETYGADGAREALADVQAPTFDLAQAEKYLSESTVPDGFTVELTYPNTGPQLGTAAQSIAENLKPLGIDVQVREAPIEEWLATIGDGEHGLSYMWYFSTTGDPAEISTYLLGPDNPNMYEDPQILDLLAQSNAAADAQERIALLLQVEQVNAAQVINAPLWWGQSLTFFSDKVGVKTFSPYTFIGQWGAELYAGK
jgi:peptide/nickel transport system substrate-binding protein